MVAALILILAVLVVAGLTAVGRSLRVVQQYEQGIVFRFGKVLPGTRGPGLHVIRPLGDRMQKVNMQIIAMAVPAQDGITRDNVTVRVDAVVYFRVVDPIKATVNVQNYMFAVSQQAQTSLRSIIGQSEMDQLLAERATVNRELRRIIDEPTEGPWGIRVERVEIKDVSLPEGMKRSMSRQAEAERERRARIITADGEYQASKRLAAAANVMARDPAALQLRLLQTVVEVAAEKNSTLVMPIPVELLRFFDKTPVPIADSPAERTEMPEDLGDAEVAAAEAQIAGESAALGIPAVAPVPEIAPVPDVAPVPEVAPIPEVADKAPAAAGHTDLADTMPGQGEYRPGNAAGFAPLTGLLGSSSPGGTEAASSFTPDPASSFGPASDSPAPFDAGPYDATPAADSPGHREPEEHPVPAEEPGAGSSRGADLSAQPSPAPEPGADADTAVVDTGGLAAQPPPGPAGPVDGRTETATLDAVPGDAGSGDSLASGTRPMAAVSPDDPAPPPRRRSTTSSASGTTRRTSTGTARSGTASGAKRAPATRRRKPADEDTGDTGSTG